MRRKQVFETRIALLRIPSVFFVNSVVNTRLHQAHHELLAMREFGGFDP
jgi:hypothetical protein